MCKPRELPAGRDQFLYSCLDSPLWLCPFAGLGNGVVRLVVKARARPRRLEQTGMERGGT